MSSIRIRPEVAWPAAVISLLVAGAAAAFAVLFFARSDGGPAIVPDYYRQGVAWDSTAAERGAADRFGWSVDVRPAPGAAPDREIRIVILDSLGAPVPRLDIEILAYRPQDAVPVARGRAAYHAETGEYSVRLPIRDRGLWDFDVRGAMGTDRFAVRIRRELTG